MVAFHRVENYLARLCDIEIIYGKSADDKLWPLRCFPY